MKRAFSPAYRHLLNTQKKIYNSLKTEAEQLLGETPEPILKYEREYQKEFRELLLRNSVTSQLHKKDLISEIRKADVTLIADFHTFSQAQRTALRLIRDSIRPRENWCIGVEMVPSHLQSELDRFQAGKLPLHEFHRIINYRSDWGFPWAHYRPLFDWAREHGIRLIALNRPKEMFYPYTPSTRALVDLRKRDEWAAGIITDLMASQKRLKMIVLYGELHLGRSHLPQEIDKISRVVLHRPLHCLSVHQNHDGLFWKFAEKPSKDGSDVVRISRNSYCVFSSTPWAKLQSLVTWAESFNEEEADSRNSPVLSEDGDENEDDDEDFDSEFEADYHHWIATFSDFFSELFQVPRQETETLTIKTVDEADFLEQASKRANFLPEELKMLRYLVENGFRTYIPRIETVFLATPSANGAAELAALHLYRKTVGSSQIFSNHPDDFYRAVIESMFAFFGSLLLNPMRKCDLPSDHQRRIRSLLFKKGSAYRLEREARVLALHFYFRKKTPSELERDLKDRKLQLSTVTAAIYLGRMLAKKLNQAFLHDEITLSEIRDLILHKPSRLGRGYVYQYRAILKRIAGKRIEQSKGDRL